MFRTALRFSMCLALIAGWVRHGDGPVEASHRAPAQR